VNNVGLLEIANCYICVPAV